MMGRIISKEIKENLIEGIFRLFLLLLRIDPNNEKATRYINRTTEELNKLRGFSG